MHTCTTCVRSQVLNFAVKLALRQTDNAGVQSLASFVLEMARFDLSHDLRDRARFMTAMLGLATADEGVDEAALLALNAKAGQVRDFAHNRFLDGGSCHVSRVLRTWAGRERRHPSLPCLVSKLP